MTLDGGNGESKRLVLEVLGAGGSTTELPRAGVLSVGSSTDKANLVVTGQGVADVHCAIGRLKGGGWALKDLGSEYGTLVNGERVQSKKLEAGDLILIGSRRLRVVDPDAPVIAQPEPKPAPPKAAPAPQPPKLAPEPVAQKPVPPAAKPPFAGTSYEQTPLPRFAGYRVEKLLGRGGMGEVFLAIQERLDRKVALKLLADKYARDVDFVRRFQAEARAAAALNHPNVVVVHDVGEEGGRHFLSMEYMEKGNLEARLTREGKLGWQEVLQILHDASSALVYAEMRGIVHRDIKPANLMQSSVGTTKVADLGLATHLEAEATESDNKKIFGTPHFISPEQARGERVDGRSDLYSLGATAYRLLSGRTPFEGNSTRDILRGHFFETPKPLAELVPGLPPELAAIVHKLLQKKPEDRFASASELLQAVDRLRSHRLHGAPAPVKTKSNSGVFVALLCIASVGAAVWWFTREKGSSDGRGTVATPGGRGPDGSQLPQPQNGAGNGEDLTALPDSPVAPPRDNDIELKRIEAEAGKAFAAVSKELAPEDRLRALKLISVKYAGTTAAAEATEEAKQLEVEVRGAAAAATVPKTEADAVLARLREAAQPSGDLPRTPEVIASLAAVGGVEQFAADPEFAAARRAIYRDAMRHELTVARARVSEADKIAEEGNFEEVEQRLNALLPGLAVPDLPPDLGEDDLPEHSQLRQWEREVRIRIMNLAGTRVRFAVAQEQKDRALVAENFGGQKGLESELRALDFTAAIARLEALAPKLAVEARRKSVLDLKESLGYARRTLEELAAEFGKGNWRRKTLIDPRKRSTSRNVSAADAQGITLEVDGALETVPWSAFIAKPKELNQLFFERLPRPYTHEEAAGIDALMRTAAVLHAVESASEMFVRNASARFDEGEVREMLEGFELAKPWADQAGQSEALARESQAAEILATALRQSSVGSWSATVAGVERLLSEFPDTLLVRLMSNGGAIATAPVSTSPGTNTSAPAPAEPPAKAPTPPPVQDPPPANPPADPADPPGGH